MTKKKGRILSVLLAAALTFTSMSTLALADEETQVISEEGLCEHHTEHTDDCGYDEAAGTPCQYVCEECKTADETQMSEDDKQATGDEDATTLPSNESPEGDKDAGGVPEDKSSATLITEWSWIDEEDYLQETDGVWGIGMPGANEDNPLTQDILLSMLPTQINATTADGENVVVDITWDLSSIPEEGIWSGDHTFTASLPEGYELADGANALNVKVELGGAETYALSDYTVEGISPQGTTINLFNYSNGPVYNNQGQLVATDEYYNDSNAGINQGRQPHFHAGSPLASTPASINTWSGAGGAPLQGFVENTLTDGYPVLKQQYYTAEIEDSADITSYVNRESLAYLFNGEQVNGKEAYMDVDGLLQIDGDGYYYYNAAYNGKNWTDPADGFASANFAVFDEGANSFILYDKGAVKNVGSGKEGESGSPWGQFFPFNSAEQVFEERGDNLQQRADVTSQGSNDGTINHYFGLTMTSRFVQRENGTNNEKDVTYQFSGDDDVWVFIDGVLVGDLGGIHDACSFTINFRTGAVVVKDSQGSTVQNTTLRDLYNNAGKVNEVAWSTTNVNTFADDTYHTLNFFYLERGNNDSNMSLKFNLVTVPQSSVFKVDQAGDPVANAEFKLYKADENYKYSESDLICSGSTNEQGEFVFVDEQGFLISLEELYNNKSIRYLVLKETKAPAGYRKPGDIHLRFDEGNGNLVLLSSNQWETGAYANGSITVSADNIITLDDRKTVNLDDVNGTLFAVVMRYTGSESAGNTDLENSDNWVAMYGDPIDGWHSADSTALASALEAAKKNLEYNNNYSFEADSSGAFSTTLTDVPGDITKYYHMLGANDSSQTKYALAFFYTEASGIGGATEDNTYRVLDEGDTFKRTFSVNLYVTDAKNNLYVQKLDDEGHPVSADKGTATFSLIPADDNGNYNSNNQAWSTQQTQDLTEPFELTGGVWFTGIPNGKYYLVETQAPSGYKKSDEVIPVVVNDRGVYVDAGEADDGVTVSRGVGNVFRSMVQFAAEDDVDATLHDIKATLQTAKEYSYNDTTGSDQTDWRETDPVQITHLQYLKDGRSLDYGPTADEYSLSLRTDVGWSKLLIQQCMDEDHGADTTSPKQDLGDRDLVNVFSGTVIVEVENDRVGGLTISKEVQEAEGQTAPEEDSFAFTVSGDIARQQYDTILYNVDGTQTSGSITFNADGKAEVSLKDKQSIYIANLPIGSTFTVTETPADNYETSVSNTGGEPYEKGNAGSAMITNTGNAHIAFLNTYSPVADFAFLKTNSTGTALLGASFALYEMTCENPEHNHENELVQVEENGTVSEADANCWRMIGNSATSAQTGLVQFTAIPVPAAGETYRLVEYSAPEGYNTPNGQWILGYDTTDNAFEVSGSVGNPPAFKEITQTVDNVDIAYSVFNYRLGELPFSGNIGIKLFLIIGGTLMLLGGAGGAIWYKTHRRVRVRGIHRRHR